MSKSILKFVTGLFIACLIAMLVAYHSGYDNSINWEVTTTGEIIEFPAWTLETSLMLHEITGEKYLLKEKYSGSEIRRSLTADQALLGLMWIGLCMALVASTYLKRYAFFVVVALFALFLNRLNLFEVGLFGQESKLIILLPFISLITPLVIFHEYKKSTPFKIRVMVLIFLSAILLLGVQDRALFTDHFTAHSLYGFSICTLIFLFIISEEIIYSILYVVTSGKGGKSNHLHFLILSIIYLGNLTLYYLNKSGLYENSFFFFDPFILLAITCVISIWSIKHKAGFLSRYLSAETLLLLMMSMGIVALSFLAYHLIRGNDSVYQAFHYFILYFHIGFGAFFFLYIIGNFIDPLIKGFEVHKIAYRERNFPYASARLGGFFAVLAFYFLAGQEPFSLLNSGYYNYLAEEATTEGNELLANEYTLQASYLGYNTHYANYKLGYNAWKKANEYPAKTYFFSAAQRFPSDYALVNYGNLDAEINPNKVQAIYEESLRSISSPEIENNLGVIHLEKAALDKSLAYFENTNPSDSWNNAPLINKWNVLKKLEVVDSVKIDKDYINGNYGVKSNILTTQTKETSLDFTYNQIKDAGQLHRQAYLLNGSYLFKDDSLETFIRRELEESSDGTFNKRLRKALALHLYKKGQVNEAFLTLDYLQANAHQYYKGEYLSDLGKLALDQNANRLALDFFNQAIEVKHTAALFGQIEAMVRLGRKDDIPDVLLKSLKKNPELTDQANRILGNLDVYAEPKISQSDIPLLDTLNNEQLIKIGRLNAFHEDQVIAVVDELQNGEASGGYELLVDATEINPYSTRLLKKYALVALDWNLTDYADQTLDKLRPLMSSEDFDSFKTLYEQRKKELEEAEW